MAVITISRQYASGGDEIANLLCEKLGYKHFDKRMIAQAAVESGLSAQESVDYSEESYQVRTFLDRLFNPTHTVATARFWKEDATGARVPEEIRLNEDVAVSLVQKAVRSAVQLGNVVIVGRAGQVILQDQPGVLHLRIEAPVEERIYRLKEQLREERKAYLANIVLRRDAQDLIIERDAASAEYLRRFYHVDWADPLLYHLVINTGKVSIHQAVDLILDLAHEIESQADAAVATA